LAHFVIFGAPCGTGALLGALAPLDAKQMVRGDMAVAMHALRRGGALLRGVMDVFLREPLIDWQREAKQAGAYTRSR
jgi:DNA-dependent protein kinase catalytic subunit